mgnify:FL=1
MTAATIFKTLTTVTLSITLLITGGCNNMEAKKEETGKNTAIENIFARKSVRTYTPQPIEKEKSGFISKSCHGCTDSSKQAALGFRGSG